MKIENLLSSQSVLEEEVNSFAKFVKDSPVPICPVDVEANLVAARVSCTIVDELAERDKRKKNIVICNLPEGKDSEEDKLSVLSLLKTAYDLENQINRVVRLGRRIENMHRPLLICFESAEDKK